MSNIGELSRLFAALRTGDLEAARAVAETIAAAEELRGHGSAAHRLRSSLRSRGNLLMAPSPPAPAALPDALVPLDAPPLKAVELEPPTRRVLSELIDEHRSAHVLAERGLVPRRRLLLLGPSGCGKSLVSAALGHELDLPVFGLRLEALMGALLGQTAQRLHAVFRFAEATPCVLLVDEVDTIGRQRGEQRELGELDRVVVTLMQELDWSKLPGVLVATSNFPSAIDPALWRRFDVTLELPLPGRQRLRRFFKKRVKQLGLDPDDAALPDLPADASYAFAESMALDHARRAVLRHDKSP